MSTREWRQCLAEMLGTFYWCFAGIAAIIVTFPPFIAREFDGQGALEITPAAALAVRVCVALAHGLALSVALAIAGGISGGHLNPAVTIGALITGRIRPVLALAYIAAQLGGGAVAAALCTGIFPDEAIFHAKLGVPLPKSVLLVAPAAHTIVLAEAVMTFLLVTAWFGTTVDERGKRFKIGSLAVGLTLTFCILAGGPITGASLNPARSLGPALVRSYTVGMEAFNFHWCYWVGPLLGGLAAALFYHYILLPRSGEEVGES